MVVVVVVFSIVQWDFLETMRKSDDMVSADKEIYCCIVAEDGSRVPMRNYSQCRQALNQKGL